MSRLGISSFLVFCFVFALTCLAECPDPVIAHPGDTVTLDKGGAAALVSLAPGGLIITSSRDVQLRTDPLPCTGDNSGIVLGDGKSIEIQIDRGGTYWLLNIGDKKAKVSIIHVPKVTEPTPDTTGPTE